MDLGTVQKIYEAVSIPLLMLGIGNVLFLAILLKWHASDGQFDFRRALIDPATKAISSTRLGIFVALFASTEWGMYLIVTDKFTEWFYGTYMAAWVLYGAVNKHTNAKVAIAGAKMPSHEEPAP